MRSNNPFPDIPDISGGSLVRRAQARAIKPIWHAPWKLMRVISGHLGWVRSVTVEPGNKWFATGAGDRTIKVRHSKSFSSAYCGRQLIYAFYM